MADGAVFDACIYCEADDVDGRMLEEAAISARKVYRCCECYRTITVGERHWRAKGTWRDGGWWSERTCETCHRVRESLLRGSWVFGDLWSQVIQAYCLGEGCHIDEDAVEAMVPESYLHPVRYRCRTEHVQDCGHCDDYDCCDNTRRATRPGNQAEAAAALGAHGKAVEGCGGGTPDEIPAVGHSTDPAGDTPDGGVPVQEPKRHASV